MKRIIGLFLAFSLLIPNFVYAKTYHVFSDGEILIEDKTLPNSEITYTVLQNGKSLSDYDGTNAIDVFVAYDETKSDAEGKYAIDFKTTLSSSEFPVILAIEGVNEISEDVIYYVNKTEHQSAKNLLNSASDLKQFLLDNKYALGINAELLNETTASKTANLFEKENFDIAQATYEELAKVLNKSAAVAALCNNSVQLFSDYIEYFDIPAIISKWLNKGYLDSNNYSDIENLLTKNYNSVSDFEKDLKTAIVLVTVKEADGFGYTRDIIKDFGNDIGILVSKVTQDVAIELTGKNYNSVDSLNEAIKDFYKDTEESDNNSGSSSSSSKRGGGGGGFSAITVNQPPKSDEEIPEQIPNTPQYVGKFVDLSEFLWAHEAINALTSLNVINGKSEKVFAPNDLVLREEFVKIAMRTANFANLYGEMNFEDVSKEDWYYQDVKNAYLAGIINGVSNERFGSGMAISRQDMAVILYNLLLKKGVSLENSNPKTFSDKSEISDYAVVAVEMLSSANIISGDENLNFNPKDNATRAEAAKMVYGILSYIKR